MFTAIPLIDFAGRIGMCTKEAIPTWGAAESIVSLRGLVSIEAVQPMRREYLSALMKNVVLAGDATMRVYSASTVQTMRIDPHSVRLGQTFVERSKYQCFLEGFDALFTAFCVPRGMAKLGACIVLGKTADGKYAIAHYIPPIIELIGDKPALLDGVHRMFLARQIGTTLETVVVDRVAAPFPADLHGWDKVSVVTEKPPLEKRFTNLRRDLFRDLKHVGVDG
jgi:hypothetical protein